MQNQEPSKEILATIAEKLEHLPEVDAITIQIKLTREDNKIIIKPSVLEEHRIEGYPVIKAEKRLTIVASAIWGELANVCQAAQLAAKMASHPTPPLPTLPSQNN